MLRGSSLLVLARELAAGRLCLGVLTLGDMLNLLLLVIVEFDHGGNEGLGDSVDGGD